MSKIEIKEWRTILSDIDGLYFQSVQHNDKLIAIFNDENNNYYSVSCNNVLSYRVSDEEVLLPYWEISKGKIIGNTRIIEGTELLTRANNLNPNTIHYHYLIATYDYCLELICSEQPRIKKN